MNEELHHRVREDDLAFFGRIGADVSHEMRNVLSVIGEYAGLLDDLLALAEGGTPADPAKLKTLAVSMTRQVRKGTEVMERFSRFAHAADGQTASFDLAALIENMAALAQRHATLAGCRLETELPDQPIPVRTNPFSLQHVIFSAIQMILESMEKGELVTIKPVAQEAAAAIFISGRTTGEGSGRLAPLSAVMSELKGEIETSWAEGRLSLILTLPIK